MKRSARHSRQKPSGTPQGSPGNRLLNWYFTDPRWQLPKQLLLRPKQLFRQPGSIFPTPASQPPFDALVVERSVAPGSFAQAGSTIATLYSTDRAEITINLSAAQWAGMPDIETLNKGTWPVTLVHAQTGRTWAGYILRASRQANEQSRQQSVIVALDHPLNSDSPLLFGSFVTVNIEGPPKDGLWALPGSAFSQKGEIWYVKPDNTLASFTTEPVFSHGQSIYVTPPEDIAGAPQKVLIHPLNHYLDDMAVTPVQENTNE